MSWKVKGLAAAMALGLAAPAMPASGDDAKDTVTEKKADARKGARSLKGSKTTADRTADAKDSAVSGTAKAKKSARSAGRKVKRKTEDATK